MQNTQHDPLLNVDSYGCLFMYATHRDLTTAPRHLIRMNEPVRPDVLLEAVQTALRRFPQMGLGLIRGETAYQYRYLDKPPVVLPMEDRSPYFIGSDDTNGYLFLCGYRDNTIYLEYQHCTSDGRGFDQFIRCVLFHYLKLCGHPIENDGTIRTADTPYDPRENEDAYIPLRHLPQSDRNHNPDMEAFHLPEYDNMEESDELVTEITLPATLVRGFTKGHDISPLPFMMTTLSTGMYRTYYKGTDRKEAIVAEVPLDLRQYLDSPTVRFFLSLLDLPFPYEYFSMPFVEACQRCRDYFATQRALPHAVYWALKNAKRVHSAHKSDLPVSEKEEMMRKQARDYIRRDSFILTNVGRFAVPACMEPYIEEYGAILPCAHQPFGALISSYRDEVRLTLSQRDQRPLLVENIVEVLREQGFAAKTYSYISHPTRYDGLRLAK